MTSFAADLASCLAFWSRLPLPKNFVSDEKPNFRRMVRALPLAGLVIAAPSTLILALAGGAGLAPASAALLAVMVLVVTTGALHEDGLADCADSLGGSDPVQRLKIMKDSRIGVFGGLALVFSVSLRASALAELFASSPVGACLAFWGLAGFARVAGLLPLAAAPAANPKGLGASASSFDNNFIFAWFGALLSFVPAAMAGLSMTGIVAAILISLGAVALTIPFAKSRYGGATGDVSGAAEQICEITFLLTLSAQP